MNIKKADGKLMVIRIKEKPKPKISDVSMLKICEDIHCQGCLYIVDCPTCMG